MIDLMQVSKRYGAGPSQVTALQALSEQIAQGEFLVVTGRSGAGKSTFLSLIGGLIRPDGGTVKVQGRDLWAMSDRDRSQFRAQTMGFIFQFASLIPTLSVLENVMLPTAFLPAGQGGGRERAISLLEQVGLKEQTARMPWQLSGGQQKRVAVARALLHNPPLLLADEPTADLDEETEGEIVALFQELNRAGTTVVMVTHNLDLVEVASRHLVLAGGRIAVGA